MKRLSFGELREVLDMDLINEINVDEFIKQKDLDVFNHLYYHIKKINFVESVMKTQNYIPNEYEIEERGKIIHISTVDGTRENIRSASMKDSRTKKLQGVIKYCKDNGRLVLYILSPKGMTTFNSKNTCNGVEIEIFSSNSSDKLIIKKEKNNEPYIQQRGTKYRYRGSEEINEISNEKEV